MIEAKPNCCQECSYFAPPGVYLPCNKPATHKVWWLERSEGPYLMCGMHAWHSERNRGAITEKIA